MPGRCFCQTASRAAGCFGDAGVEALLKAHEERREKSWPPDLGADLPGGLVPDHLDSVPPDAGLGPLSMAHGECRAIATRWASSGASGNAGASRCSPW